MHFPIPGIRELQYTEKSQDTEVWEDNELTFNEFHIQLEYLHDISCRIISIHTFIKIQLT